MARQKRERIVELIPKNHAAIKRLAYHGSRWILRRVADTVPGYRQDEGPYMGCMSKDGKAFIWVRAQNDPDFAASEIR